MNFLNEALTSFSKELTLQQFKDASNSLSACYKQGGTLRHHQEMMAYLFVRMPATYAVLLKVLAQIPAGSILDLGAGPGTVWWAAKSVWECEPKITAVEREETFISFGQKLGAKAHWKKENFLLSSTFEPHDWVVFSYSLAEIAESELPKLLTLSWQAAKKGVVIVEPGTPKGFERILLARQSIIQLGGHCFAPCPHSNDCPLQSAANWCHFSARLNRSFHHRQAKSAHLGFEDEKFSYVIMAKDPHPALPSRILHSPQQRPGHIHLQLCTSNGLQNQTITRSQKELYKKVRKASWGDPL